MNPVIAENPENETLDYVVVFLYGSVKNPTLVRAKNSVLAVEIEDERMVIWYKTDRVQILSEWHEIIIDGPVEFHEQKPPWKLR
jgi:hypothetical protein